MANKKLLLFDTGIYLSECRLDVGDLLASDNWHRSGANAKIDYVTQIGSEIIPIEVKASGKGSMQSMRSYLNIHTNTPYGIRMSLENFTRYENIQVIPV